MIDLKKGLKAVVDRMKEYQEVSPAEVKRMKEVAEKAKVAGEVSRAESGK